MNCPKLELAVIGDLLMESQVYHPTPLKGVVGVWGLEDRHFSDSSARAAFAALKGCEASDATARGELLLRSHGAPFVESAIDAADLENGAAEDRIRRLAERGRKRLAAESLGRLLQTSENYSEDAFFSEAARIAREGTRAASAACGERSPLAAQTIEDFLAMEPAPLDPIVASSFEAGDKVELIAPSKCRKSFWALDLALHVAAGMPFCGLAIPKPRKVLLVNLEIKRDWMKRRIANRLRGYGLSPADLGGRLSLMNCRGLGGHVRESILAHIQAIKPDFVILDPRYKLMRPDEDENTGNGLIGILNLLDAIAEENAAVMIVSHDKKGDVKTQDIRDRGAGSNWAARDVDCRFVLTPAKNDDYHLNVAVLARNYPPRRPIDLRAEADRFFQL